MSETAENFFKCQIVSPAGKLLDCDAISVTFTAYDGSVGVLYNHMPMLNQLGLGLVEVTLPVSQQEKNNNENIRKKVAFIDGGVALVCANLVKITASDAICAWEDKEKIEHFVQVSQQKLDKLAHTAPQYQYEKRKNELLKKILALV